MHGKIRTPLPWERATQLAIIVLGIIVTAGALKIVGAVAVPVVAALVAGLAMGPLADRLGRLGVPAVPMAVLLVVALTLGVAIVSTLISAPLASWVERAPDIGATLQQKLRFLSEPLQAVQQFRAMVSENFGGERALAVEMAAPLGQTIVTTLSPALGQVLIFIGTLLFLLIGRERMRRGVVLAFAGRESRLTALKVIVGIQQDLGRYFGTITLINAGLGVIVGAVMLVLGLASPVLWATLTFALNFIPFIGPIVMAILIGVAGLVTFDSLGGSMMPAAAFLVLHGIESQFVTPALLGHRFDINPLIVFLAIVFGAWMWGAAGAFLAVPILVIATSVWYRSVHTTDLLPD